MRQNNTIFINEISKSIWEQNYRYKNEETVNDTHLRVAKYLASVEKDKDKWTEEFYKILGNFACVPGGRITSNAGTYLSGNSYINCFVSAPGGEDQDSMEGILRELRHQALILKSEGGYGFCADFLRPRGAVIGGIGNQTPGSVKFLECWDKQSEVITSGSGKKRKSDKEKVKIRKGAQMVTLSCVAGNTLISTIDGKIAIKDLVGKNPYVYCTDGNGSVFIRKAKKVFMNGRKKTIRVFLDNDSVIDCTENHKIMLSNGSYKNASNLKAGESLCAFYKTLYKSGYKFIGATGTCAAIPEHHAICEMKYGVYPSATGNNRSPEMTVGHHIDGNKINNNPSNIELISLSDHLKIHDKRNSVKKIVQISKDRKGLTIEEYFGKQKADIIRKNMSNGQKGRTPWNKGIGHDEYVSKYKNGFKNQFSNHKVIKIETLYEQEVFDISVPDYHNFVANDIFVHNCWHPDIIEFIEAKKPPGRLVRFNMSVLCTDDFMNAIKNNLSWSLIFPNYRKYPAEYKEYWDGDIDKWNKLNLKDGMEEYYKFDNANELWDLIMQNAYNRNEPGVIFIDTVNKFNNLNYIEKIKSCNPCGEQYLPTGGCCLLGSINLTQFIDFDNKNWNYNKLREYIPIIVRMLDNVNDLTYVPLDVQVREIKNKRRIGIGVLGYASALILLRLRYGSKRSLEITEELMKFIMNETYKASALLAKEKGVFPLYNKDEYLKSEFLKNLDKEVIELIKQHGIRNSHLLSIQPTGNSSILANNTSTGLEPIFSFKGIRTIIQPHTPSELSIPKFIDWDNKKYEGKDWDWNKDGDEDVLVTKFDDSIWKIYQDRGITKEYESKDYAVNILEEKGLWDKDIRYAVSVDDLSIEDHVKTMEVFAKYLDSAMSKTVNLPFDYLYDDFKALYMKVYDTGIIKGCTVYRKGTSAAVLSDKSILDKVFLPKGIVKLSAPQRPKTLPCEIHRVEYKGKKWLVFVGLLNNDPYEVFTLRQKKIQLPKKLKNGFLTKIGKGKYNLECEDDFIIEDITELFETDEEEVITRLISTALRHGVDIEFIIDQLLKATGTVVSFNKVIARTLKKYLSKDLKIIVCQFCSSKNIIMIDGCFQCKDCGKGLCD